MATVTHVNGLRQRSFWTGADGRRRRIQAMDQEHAGNAASWLQAHAVSLLCRELLAKSPDDVQAKALAQILADPAGLMSSTPLHKALVQRAVQK